MKQPKQRDSNNQYILDMPSLAHQKDCFEKACKGKGDKSRQALL